MLLEANIAKENAFVIYSRNSTDENFNFRIIFLNDPNRYHRIISFSQIKNFITEYFPKNLIAYRVLSNFPDFSITTKYGCTILLDKKPELIFTDTVFAVKTIEEYLGESNNVEFRFRIQKVGYSSKEEFESEANYNEEFSFDLNIDEVINQNDGMFVNTLLKNRNELEKKKQFESELKRNIIFTPENQSISAYLGIDITSEKSSRKEDIESIESRDMRSNDNIISFNDNKLYLRNRSVGDKEKNRQIELSFNGERENKIIKIQSESNVRHDQKRLRVYNRSEESHIKMNNEKEMRLNIVEDKLTKGRDFRKLQSPPPVQIRKVEISEDGSEDEITNEDQKETLFSTFLKNLKNESSTKTMKKNYKKDSAILELFKSVQNTKSYYDKNEIKQVILKTGNKNDK